LSLFADATDDAAIAQTAMRTTTDRVIGTSISSMWIGTVRRLPKSAFLCPFDATVNRILPVKTLEDVAEPDATSFPDELGHTAGCWCDRGGAKRGIGGVDGTRTCSRDAKGDDFSRAEGHDIS
jgi:hypothetical protein